MRVLTPLIALMGHLWFHAFPISTFCHVTLKVTKVLCLPASLCTLCGYVVHAKNGDHLQWALGVVPQL